MVGKIVRVILLFAAGLWVCGAVVLVAARVASAAECGPPPWPPAGKPVVRIEPGDIRALSEVIYGEGRGESLCGQMAIGFVVLNRMRRDPKTWGGTVAQVVAAPNQFSSFGKTDPNLKRMKRADESEHSFYFAQQAAMAVLGGAADFTMGATHFHHVGMDPYPKWAARLTRVARVGAHVFYK